MKHTPGPWINVHEVILCERDRETLDYPAVASCVGDYNAEANAWLIAAAPELLGALQECADVMDSLRDFVSEGGSRLMVGAIEAIRMADSTLEIARAAIAKAEGR